MKGRLLRGGGGGIGGSGIHGVIGGGVLCKSEDNSWYCTLTKFTSAIMQILLIFVFLYVIWTFVSPMFRKKTGIFSFK